MNQIKEQTTGKIKAQVIKMSDLISYQKDSIVSRTLIDKDAGNVTVFALDEDQGLSEHKAPFDALVMVLEGEVEVTISGKPLRLKEGEMVIMPANKPHALKAIKKFMMMLIMIRS